jgi:hypothetical protein
MDWGVLFHREKLLHVTTDVNFLFQSKGKPGEKALLGVCKPTI